jgi:hypothetical protein
MTPYNDCGEHGGFPTFGSVQLVRRVQLLPRSRTLPSSDMSEIMPSACLLSKE